MLKPASTVVGVILALLMLASMWLYVRFPVYNEENATALVERNIPVGTSQMQVSEFLDSLKEKDVIYSAQGQEIVAYFPSSIWMRGWWHIGVYLQFKNGKLASYRTRPIKI
jgi:hypothetical protein